MAGEKIRVLHVITRLIVGGAQENTLLTVTHLDRTRYDVTLASGPTTGPEGSLEDRIPGDIAFQRIPELVRQPDPVKDVLSLWRLVRLMRKGRFHIVHTHTTKAGLLGRIAARLAQIPVVIHTPHGHAFHDYLGTAGSTTLQAAERWLTRWTDQIICLTEAERRDYLRFRIGPPERFAVIHSGVDVERFRRGFPEGPARRQVLGLPADGPLIGCVARLVPVKGVHVLLEAVPRIRAAMPGATVVFVGDGPLRAQLERRSASLGLNGAAAFLGLRQDIAEIISLFDVVVVPSLNEGMGRVVIEAQASGRPVVASRVSGIQDLITHGQTGLLVPPADAEALAGAIIRCLTDSALADSLARRAQAGVDAYAVAPMIAEIDRLYIRWLRERL